MSVSLWPKSSMVFFLFVDVVVVVAAGVVLRYAAFQRPAVHAVLGVQRGDLKVLAPVPTGSENARCCKSDIDGRTSECRTGE